MAFLIKDDKGVRPVGPVPGQSTVSQSYHVQRAAATLPQTSNYQLFRVEGGRVLVKLLIGTVTTVIQGTDPVAKVTAGALTAAGALIGTVYDIAATIDMSSDEVGTIYTVEGDGTALISPQLAGAGYGAPQPWIMPVGQIYLVTGASKTGALKWDIWYEPLDPGATVRAVDVVTVAVT